MLDTLPQIDKADPLPRHIQVQQVLREMVTSGRLQPGDKIPAETHIARSLGVSKMTVNKAILALTASGLFVREVGRGTFVAGSPPENASFVCGERRPRIVLSFVEGARNVLDSHYYSTLYQGVVDALGGESAARAAVDLSLSSHEDRGERPDGRLIIAPRPQSVSRIEAAWKQGESLVVLGASWPGMGVPSVDSDNVGGASAAVRHLANLGHRHVALLFAEEETANIRDRIEGYRRALKEAGLAHDPADELRAGRAWQVEPGIRQRLIARLNAPDAPVTAIFAAGHYLALEAMNIIREAGRDVPGDVSVVGYDDPISAQLVYPALTTVRQPLHEMGRRAAERLVRLVRGEERRAAVRELLPCDLITRRSAAPAPAHLASLS